MGYFGADTGSCCCKVGTPENVEMQEAEIWTVTRERDSILQRPQENRIEVSIAFRIQCTVKLFSQRNNDFGGEKTKNKCGTPWGRKIQ